MDPITCKSKGENKNHLKLKEDQTNQAIVYFWGRINEKFDKIKKNQKRRKHCKNMRETKKTENQ